MSARLGIFFGFYHHAEQPLARAHVRGIMLQRGHKGVAKHRPACLMQQADALPYSCSASCNGVGLITFF